MRDLDIRTALHQKLDARFAGDESTRILDELGICQGAVRVDVAVVNGLLHGYEIKSERDTLDRLPAQQEAYSRVFDMVTIVTGSTHLDKVLARVPEWWGVALAGENAGAVTLSPVREPSSNPSVDPSALVQLLWRDEALELLEQYGCSRGVRAKSRKVIWGRLASEVPLEELKAHVRATLKARENWRGRE